MKQWISLLLTALLLCTPAAALEQPSEEELSIGAPSAILIERETGTVLYEKNADERLSPASVTKIMTLLLIFEQLDSGRLSTDTVVTASANACAMGGSQIWLREGEQMTVDEMIKCIAVSSANDCAVAMAEHICGSEAAFTKRMNERAQALGMENTHFLNSTGLTDDPAHYTTARDIAVMSRALLAYPRIRDYTTIWMDTVRDGRFGLANTNKLIHGYPGATGLKTGDHRDLRSFPTRRSSDLRRRAARRELSRTLPGRAGTARLCLRQLCALPHRSRHCHPARARALC